MATGNGSFVDQVPLEDEVPVPELPRNVDRWVENYCGHGYDFDSRVGYWYHIGRWVQDPRIWRERVAFLLPDDTVRVHQSFGARDTSHGPAGALLDLACVSPGKEWDISYRGPARETTLEQLMQAPMTDPTELDIVSFSARFRATMPMWYFPSSENETWGKWHTEQQGQVTGAITVDGKTYEIDGHGYSDHSRGPRQLSSVQGACWIQLQFEDGDFLGVFQMWHAGDAPDVPKLSVARYVHAGESIDGKVLYSPRLTDVADLLEPCDLRVEVEGRNLDIGCFPVATFAHSLNGKYSHTMWGAMLGDTTWPQTVFNQPSLFTLDGRRAEGWMERCIGRRETPFSQADTRQAFERNRARLAELVKK